MASVPFVLFFLLVAGSGADYCDVTDDYLHGQVRILLCGSSTQTQCKSESGEVEAKTGYGITAECVKCKVPGKSCTKHEDCCAGELKGISGINRGTCLTGICTVCGYTGRDCNDKAPLCCGTETNSDIQCRATTLTNTPTFKEYKCLDDRCKGVVRPQATCSVDGYAGVIKLCDCPTEKFTSMECRGESCTSCKRYLGPCNTTSECCDGADCVDQKCKPKCLGMHALCNQGIPCCSGSSCMRDALGNHQCYSILKV